MPRTFAYLRVSTTGQMTENQLREIIAAGFQVEPRRVVPRPSPAGWPRRSVAASPGCSTDWRVVTKLDRLGRNAIDVGVTVKKLAEMGVRCTAWRSAVSTSPARPAS